MNRKCQIKYVEQADASSSTFNVSRRNGQVMILTVLALGGAILGATTIAGILMLYQIRQATDLTNSGKAIYAADAGLEWTLYNWFCASTGKTPCPAPDDVTWNRKTMNLGNGSKVTVTQTCFDASGAVLPTCTAATNASSTTFKSLGASGNSSRAFGLSF